MELKEKISELNPWFYNVKIGEVEVVPSIGSPHTIQELIDRTTYTKKIFVDEMIKRYDFKNKNILDVGANCSYWTSFYAKAGARSVTAIEGRQQFIDQALLHWSINKYLPMDKINFICGDVTNEEIWNKVKTFGPFDFCLCAGILYHIANHDFVLEKINSMGINNVLIDTRVSEERDIQSKEFIEQGEWKFDGISKNRLAKHPTLKYLVNFFAKKEYFVERVIIPDKVPPDATMQSCDNYNVGNRVSLFCCK